MSIKGQSYKKMDHPYRDKMIEKVCIEIYKLEINQITDEIKNAMSVICYKEIIKPLVYIDRNKHTLGEMQIKYKLSLQEIRTILFAASNNIRISG